MPLITGLGNIGEKYEDTRHNIGFDIVDHLAHSMNVKLGPGKGPFYFAEGRHKGHSVILLKPTTYMNLSGESVGAAMKFFKVPLEQLVVVHDELDQSLAGRRVDHAEGVDGGRPVVAQVVVHQYQRARVEIIKQREQSGIARQFAGDFRRSIDDQQVDLRECFDGV